MKRFLAVFLILLLSGCFAQDNTEPALQLRQKLLGCETCSFQTVVTADYGDEIYTFTMDCNMATDGSVTFSVVEPETICGIAGKLSADCGALTFDDQVLAFPMLADEQVTPVSAPYLLVKTLRSGYIRACGADGAMTKLQINDSYEEQALELDIWLNAEMMPVHCDILYSGRRFLTVAINNFVIR